MTLHDTGAVRNRQRFGAKVRQHRRIRGFTLEDLAAALGYSSHTGLSRLERGAPVDPAHVLRVISYLHGHTAHPTGRVEPFTQAELQELAMEYLGFDQLVGEKRGPMRLVVVPAGFGSSSFWVRVIAVLGVLAGRDGDSLTIQSHYEDVTRENGILRELSEQVSSATIRGIIWAPAQGTLEAPDRYARQARRDYILSILGKGVPCVVLDRPISGDDRKAFGKQVPVCTLDHWDAGAKSICKLWEEGHRHVGVLADVEHNIMQRLRARGAEAAWEQLRANDQSARIAIKWGYPDGPIDDAAHRTGSSLKRGFHGLRAQAVALLEENPDLTALFCTTSYAAAEAEVAITRDLRRSVPEDVSLLGFDLVPDLLRRGISSYPSDPLDIAARAYAMLPRHEQTGDEPMSQERDRRFPLRHDYDTIEWGGETIAPRLTGGALFQARAEVASCLAALTALHRPQIGEPEADRQAIG